MSGVEKAGRFIQVSERHERQTGCRDLGRRMSLLRQRVEGWGNVPTTSVIGEPLDGVITSAPCMAIAFTATPWRALRGDDLLRRLA
jgi:hypothetical protein